MLLLATHGQGVGLLQAVQHAVAQELAALMPESHAFIFCRLEKSYVKGCCPFLMHVKTLQTLQAAQDPATCNQAKMALYF